MPFNYEDLDGFLAIGPTIQQWREMRPKLTGDEGKAFVETGRSEYPLALADEIAEGASPQLDALRKAAEKANTVILLTTGTTPEEA